MGNINDAVSRFVNNPYNGEAWRTVLDFASVRARARIGLAMYFNVYKDEMSREEREEYRKSRCEVEDSLEIEDLQYLIRVMPEKKKEHYKRLEAERRGKGDVGQ